MNGDTFSFECDLDKDQPDDKRAALTVHHDGEHVVFNFSGGTGDPGREIYLTPDMGAALAHLVGELATDDVPPIGAIHTPGNADGPGVFARVVAVVMVLGLCLATLSAFVLGVVVLGRWALGV